MHQRSATRSQFAALGPSRRRSPVTIVILLGISLSLLWSAAVTGPAFAVPSDKGDVYVIQGIVGEILDIYVDERRVLASAKSKAIVGPLKLEAGTHSFVFRKRNTTVIETTLMVESGQSMDVVAHLRSDSAGSAGISAYRNDLSAVGRGKVRLTVGHTAAAPPADVRVNGEVLFSNVANGETLTVVVPGGSYQVDIVPAGTNGKAILAPIEVALKKDTLTRVFAIGNVANGSVDVVVHSLPVLSSGAVAPRSVPTGDGGQAAREFVEPDRSAVMTGSVVGLLALTAVVLFAGRRRRRQSV